jgi:hypothetical protein
MWIKMLGRRYGIQLTVALLLLVMVTTSAAMAQELEGQISGVVLDAAGRPLADRRVELHRPSREGPGRLATTTDPSGRFTYARLRPGRYEVELVVEGRVVARSGPIELSGRALSVNDVTLTQPIRPPAWVRSERRVTPLRRVSAKDLLGAQGVATSFDALEAILEPGHQVVFAGPATSRLARLATALESGGLWSGRTVLVAGVSRDRLVLVRRRLFRTQEIVLTEDAVSRIDIVDPTARGALLGAAVGGSLGLALILQTRRDMRSRIDCNLCPLGYMMGALLPVMGTGLGAAIDRSITEPIYKRQPQTPRATLAPLFGRGAIGVSAHARF